MPTNTERIAEIIRKEGADVAWGKPVINIDKAAQALHDAGLRFIPELKLISVDEMRIVSCVSKYPYKEIADVIKEACVHQLDQNIKTLKDSLNDTPPTKQIEVDINLNYARKHGDE